MAFTEAIDHGPFPFAQLKNSICCRAWRRCIPSRNTPAVKGLFDTTKGKSLFTADSRISYSGDTSSAIDIIPLDYQKISLR